MSILKNFTRIMTLNVKSFFEKSQDPISDVNEYLRELEKNLRMVKAENAAVDIEANRIKRNICEIEAEIAKYNRYIEKSKNNGNISDERIYISKKDILETEYKKLQEDYNVINDKCIKINKMENKLISDINTLRSRASELNSYVDNNKMGNMLEKVDEITLQAEALEELNNYITDSDPDFDKDFEEFINKND